MCPGGSSGGGGDGRGRVGGVPAAAILNAYIDCLVVAAGLSLSLLPRRSPPPARASDAPVVLPSSELAEAPRAIRPLRMCVGKGEYVCESGVLERRI